ncbi:hypothetical protein MVEN_01431900 [Mycena venus]|uniref:Protein kinase domain-containing protein n=1 Tax=Mycena venus TaxID=2733690 RepID=A0A8H6XVR7_9AGAR|nr:hypothetical protein MVEN_01431900 [Mycena venus]
MDSELQVKSESTIETTTNDLYKSFANNVADSSGEFVEEPAVWPVILWVAFQIQSHVHCNLSVDVDALITIIESPTEEHSGLWSWDHTDNQMLRASLLSRNGASTWVDHYPPSWREYILSLDSLDWARLGDLTRRSARERLAPPEDDAAIRAGAIAVWTSMRSVLPTPELSTILALDHFVPDDTNYRQFLSCLLERPENCHDRDRDPELIHWDNPRAWLEYNRRMLQSSVVDEYRNMPLVHVVGNAYMLHRMPHALPQRLISSVFAALLKKFGDDQPTQDFRAQVNIWKEWDFTMCLANFHRVLSSVSEFSKLIKDDNIQKTTDALMHTDILCICAQFASIFDSEASQSLCKAPNDYTQKLLDLLQDLLDYPLLNPSIHSVLLRGLLKLSKKLKQYPRCFTLRHLQLAGNPVAAGSFGDIWKTQFHKEIVCVKVMRVYEEGDIEALLKGFHHEALIWRQLAHPNILPFFGVYFSQEARSQLCLALDVALGLEYLHGQNFVHGDLKGLNVLVTRSGRAVLADFGLSSVVMDSKIVVFSSSSAKTGGTMRWQAPELFHGGRTNLASDVYALACVFYEIFTGTIPFYELTEVAVMFRVVQGDRPKQHPSITASIWNIMMECWKTEPKDRPSAVYIVSRLRDHSIGAVQNDAALDWDRWHTAKFRSSLQEHTLLKIDYSPRVPASLHAPTCKNDRIGPIRPAEMPVIPSSSPPSAFPTPPPAVATPITAPSPTLAPVPAQPPPPKTWAALAAGNPKKWGSALAQNSPTEAAPVTLSLTQSPTGPTPGTGPGAQRGPTGGQPGQHPNLIAALNVTTPQCFVKGVIEPMISSDLLTTHLNRHFGPLKDLEIVRSKACGFFEFLNLDSARKAIVMSLPQSQGGEGGVWIECGADVGLLRISIETRKQRGDRPGRRSGRGGVRGGRGKDAGRGFGPSRNE